MIKYIKTNEGYFEFLNKYKEKYNIISVKLLKYKIKVEYEKR